MTKVIYKIIDERQYKYSHAFSNVDLKKIKSVYTKKFLYNQKNDKIFSAVDRTETDNKVNNNDFYLVPLFYNHAENTETLDTWKKHAYSFIDENKSLFLKSNVVLALYDPTETSRHFVNTVYEIFTKYQIRLLVVTANKKFTSQSEKIKVVYYDYWMNRFDPMDNIIGYKPKKIYINLNRVARSHRCILMDAIIDNNLLKLGYNTWGDTYEAFAAYKSFINPNTKIDKQTFDILDIEDLSSVNPNYFVPVKHCFHSFLYLNTETNIDPEQLFFSEKVYKPIGIGMPFITLGNPGTLADLRSRGFLTFDEWWDESYDLDLDINKRIHIIINNLLKISKYKKKDLLMIRKEMQEILEHNLSLYKTLKNKNWLRESLSLYAKGLL